MLRTASETLTGGWELVEEHLPDAKLLAFDGCHKIYLAMDDIEAMWFADNYEILASGTVEQNLATLHEWFDQSCSLRFINAVWHNETDPNAGFVSLIDQFATDDDEDEEN